MSGPAEKALTQAPALALDDRSELRRSGQPVLAWRGWPPVFLNAVLLDFTLLPPGHAAAVVQPNNTLLMEVTAYRGDLAALATITNSFTAHSKQFQEEIRARDQLLALRTQFAALPGGKIAILPGATAGAGANFLKITGLESKAVRLSQQQLVDTNQFQLRPFSPHHLPERRALHQNRHRLRRRQGCGHALLGGRRRHRVVGLRPLPLLLWRWSRWQTRACRPAAAPTRLSHHHRFRAASGRIARAGGPKPNCPALSPGGLPVPGGDPRLRAVDPTQVSSAQHYAPLLRVEDSQGRSYGDAVCSIDFGAGPAKGGHLVYLWSTLLTSPQGDPLMADTLSWVIQARVK